MRSRILKIQGQKWRVKVLANHPMLEKNLGYVSNSTNEILIYKGATEDQQRSTLLHEIIHVVAAQMGLKISEEATLALESGLFQAMHDNRLRF